MSECVGTPRWCAPVIANPTHLQDLEQIEEWNEFGELRMVVNTVQDLGGMPATSNPISSPASDAAPTPKEPEPGTPKPSTIKIQSPPSKPEEKKNDQAVLALRQASQEAASKAKNKTDAPKPSESKDEPKLEKVDSVSSGKTQRGSAHRGSVAAELPDTAPDSPKAPKRPTLVPEVAAVSSANFHADNAETLGLVEHHRGSIISATDKAEQDRVVSDIRQSVSTKESSTALEAVREEAAQKGKEHESTIEEEPSAAVEKKAESKGSAEKDAPEAKEEKKKDEKEDKDTEKPKQETTGQKEFGDIKEPPAPVNTDTKEPDTKEEAEPKDTSTSAQDPKAAEEATTSVKD